MEQIQLRNDTYVFRDLEVYRVAKRRLANRQGKLRILSFGCSVGDEIVTLRMLFPKAEIVGCDINPAILETAKKSVGHLATIIVSDEAALHALGPFDFISCMSVLCLNPKPKGPAPNDFTTLFPVQKFDDMLGLLDSLLVPNGLLALTNTSYRFHESPVYEGYDPVRSDIIWRNGTVDVMARDGSPQLIQGRGYRIGKGFSVRDDEELADSIFEKRVGNVRQIHWVVMAPVPDNIIPAYSYERGSNDVWSPVPADSLTYIFRYEFGHDSATGSGGVIVTRRWKSLAHGAEHIRPPVWSVQLMDALK